MTVTCWAIHAHGRPSLLICVFYSLDTLHTLLQASENCSLSPELIWGASEQVILEGRYINSLNEWLNDWMKILREEVTVTITLENGGDCDNHFWIETCGVRTAISIQTYLNQPAAYAIRAVYYTVVKELGTVCTEFHFGRTFLQS